jgi:hypothetical protein
LLHHLPIPSLAYRKRVFNPEADKRKSLMHFSVYFTFFEICY